MPFRIDKYSLGSQSLKGDGKWSGSQMSPKLLYIINLAVTKQAKSRQMVALPYYY